MKKKYIFSGHLRLFQVSLNVSQENTAGQLQPTKSFKTTAANVSVSSCATFQNVLERDKTLSLLDVHVSNVWT